MVFYIRIMMFSQTIMLFYYEDMKVQEIADVLELPKGTVLSRLSRGRDILRKELRDYGV